MKGLKMVKSVLVEQQRLSGAKTERDCGEQYVKHR